jgi:hypothetical protein
MTRCLRLPIRNIKASRVMLKSAGHFWHNALVLQAGTLLLLAAYSGDAWAVGEKLIPTLCSSSERTIFSCRIAGARKVLSLCSSPALHAPERYLQYRFGRAGALEMHYPLQRSQSIAAFTASHYFRAQVDRRRLSFSNQGVRYTIFSDYEGEERPAQAEAGVRINKTQQGSSELTLRCKAPFVDHLADLDEIITPETDPAL